MISFISLIIRQHIFCFLGASIRYLIDFVKAKISKTERIYSFKEYRNYEEKADVEMLDAIIGFCVFGIIIIFLVTIFNRREW